MPIEHHCLRGERVGQDLDGHLATPRSPRRAIELARVGWEFGRLAISPSKPAAQIEHAAAQGSALQGGYVLLAARALGLDCGPIGGFDRAKVDEEFFPDGRWKANFLINLGYGNPAGLHPRNPRLAFDDACRIL